MSFNEHAVNTANHSHSRPADAQAEQRVLKTRLTSLWGIDVPIIGAPMAGRAGGELAASVTRAGGLGMFGVGANTSAEWIRDNAAIAAEAGPYGIGLMLWALDDHPEQWEAVCEARPRVVSLGFGNPGPYVDQAHDLGMSVVAPINDLNQLREAIEVGVDVICIQGTDAGGHTGHIGTLPLMQLALDFMDTYAPGIPTAVAGGIGSGRGVAAVLSAGADAAWVGTALLASPESLGSAELKSAAVRASSKNTVLTDIYDRAEQVAWDTETWPTRTVRNAFVDIYAPMSVRGEVTDRELIEARAEGGDFADELKLHAGQGVGLVRAERSAEDVVRTLNDEAWHFLHGRH